MQVVGDMAMVSVLVYETGLHDSYFVSLYLLVIIVGSILFSRGIAFAIAGSCAVILGGMTVLAYAGKIPPTYASVFTQEELRFWFLSNMFGFLAIAYLASLLAQSLRRKGLELEAKREELAELQEFTEDIIHSMRGGLITTDIDGRIVLLNRTGEEILGHRFAEVRGKKLFGFERTVLAAGIAGCERPVVVASRGGVPDAGWAADDFWVSAFRRCGRAMSSGADTFLIFRI